LYKKGEWGNFKRGIKIELRFPLIPPKNAGCKKRKIRGNDKKDKCHSCPEVSIPSGNASIGNLKIAHY
jgi:hypothetical protein